MCAQIIFYLGILVSDWKTREWNRKKDDKIIKKNTSVNTSGSSLFIRNVISFHLQKMKNK